VIFLSVWDQFGTRDNWVVESTIRLVEHSSDDDVRQNGYLLLREMLFTLPEPPYSERYVVMSVA
jgi:hypothetical protein